jgi:hypothetical protein
MIPFGGLEAFLRRANVLVRDLDDDILKQLEAAARAHDRSLLSYFHTYARIKEGMS